MWIVSLLGWLVIVICSVLIVVVVFGRFFRVYLHVALAPLALSTFGSEGTSQTGRHFLKSFVGVSLEAAAILVAFMIVNTMAGSLTSGIQLLPATDAVSMVWNYIFGVVVNMVLLVTLCFGSTRMIQNMFGT